MQSTPSRGRIWPTSTRSCRLGERLTLDDGVRLFDTPDLLAVGYLANREREKRHGGAHLFQLQPAARADQRVRGHLPLLLVLASAGRHARGVHDVARAGLGQAAAAREPAAHRGARRQRPQPAPAVQLLHGAAARLQAHPAVDSSEVLHGGRDRVLLAALWHERRAGAARAERGRPRFAAGRRRRDLRRARAPEDLPRQGGRRSVSLDSPHRAPHGAAHQRHDALRAHRDDGGARRSHAARARAAGRDRRVPGVHPARVPSRQQPDAQAAGADRHRHAARARGRRG